MEILPWPWGEIMYMFQSSTVEDDGVPFYTTWVPATSTTCFLLCLCETDSYELIVHPHTEEDHTNTFSFIKKIQFK